MSSRYMLAVMALGACWATAAAQTSTERIAYDQRAMYEALAPSVVKIVTDAGHGSGFLISEEGFIATSYQVVRHSRYLAVELLDRGRFAVDVVLRDAATDLAVLKVHPSVLRGLPPLPLLPEIETESVAPGMPVVAFGSPLSPSFLMAQGAVAAVEDGALRGDFLILPGNAGGPLVNLDGEVVGVNTSAGPEPGRAVPVAVLRRVFDVRFAGYDGPQPPAAPLPMLPADGYPLEALQTKLQEPPVDDEAYELDAGRFTIQAITPVRLGRLHLEGVMGTGDDLDRRQDERRHPGVADAPFHEWARRMQAWLDHAVTFEIKPDFDGAAGSTWATMSSASAPGVAPGFSGNVPPRLLPRRELKLGAEFADFRIVRDGELIEPITPGRAITDTGLQHYDLTYVDAAYSGMYVYAPDAFMDGELFRFEVYEGGERGGLHRFIEVPADSALIEQIRLDFEGTTRLRSRNTSAETGERDVVTVSLPVGSSRPLGREGDAPTAAPDDAEVDTAEVDAEEMTWRVQHVHRFFGGSHPGKLTVTAAGLAFAADNGQHSFVAGWGRIIAITPWPTLGPSGVGVEFAEGGSSQFRMDSPGMLDDLLGRAERRNLRTR